MKRFVGLLLLLAVIGVVALLVTRRGGGSGGVALPGGIGGLPGVGGGSTATRSPVTLKGLIGGEKTGFLKDPEVVKILQNRYGITVDADRRGSLDMVRDETPAGCDFLWPSSQLAQEIYKQKRGRAASADIVFNSPIVLYSWAPVADALIKIGVVQKIGEAYYVVNFPKLVRMINEGKTWKEVGLPQLYGKITIFSTDPTRSNSGNMFAGLLANVLSGGQVASEATLPKVLPAVKAFFDSQGFMEQSSDAIFRQYLTRGMGDKPIIVGYEAQMIGYGREDPQRYASRKKELRTLYPRPIVWSSHPLIAVSDNGRRLLEALQDKDLQRLGLGAARLPLGDRRRERRQGGRRGRGAGNDRERHPAAVGRRDGASAAAPRRALAGRPGKAARRRAPPQELHDSVAHPGISRAQSGRFAARSSCSGCSS
jgi:hypothetical protein